MVHNHPLDSATILWGKGDAVKLECEECGYATEYSPYGYALVALKHHWEQNQPR